MEKKPNNKPAGRTVRRRDLMLGLGAGAAFLAPFYRRVQAHAAGIAGVGNFIMFFTPNGFNRSAFGSDGNDAGFKFRSGMAGAEPMKQHISVIRGLSNKSQGSAAPFHSHLSRLMTCVSGDPSNLNIGFGPSLDQAVADLAALRPVTLKVYWSRFTNAGNYQYIAWKKAGFPNRLLNDPRQAYTDVFGTFMPVAVDNTAAMRTLEQQKSVLDFVKDDVTLFKGRLRKTDQSRLDVHLDAVRDFEKKLIALPAAGGTPGGVSNCNMTAAKKAETTPPADDSGAYNKEAFKLHGDVQASLLIASIACGVRNAGLIMWQGAAGGLNPNGSSGDTNDHHLVSHGSGGGGMWTAIDNWYAGRYARFLQELQSVGILDDTVTAWGSEITQDHSHNNQVFVVGGGKNLGFKGQKTVEFPFVGNEGGGRNAARAAGNRSLSDLWTTVYKACGAKTNFGEDVSGPITQIWSPT